MRRAPCVINLVVVLALIALSISQGQAACVSGNAKLKSESKVSRYGAMSSQFLIGKMQELLQSPILKGLNPECKAAMKAKMGQEQNMAFGLYPAQETCNTDERPCVMRSQETSQDGKLISLERHNICIPELCAENSQLSIIGENAYDHASKVHDDLDCKHHLEFKFNC